MLLGAYFLVPASPVCAQDNFRNVNSKHNGIYFTPPDIEGSRDEYVGDPMPFYDSKNNLYRIFYLRDRRNKDKDPNYHPISQVTTADVMAYKEINNGNPILKFGTEDPAFGTGSVIYNESQGEYVMFYTGHSDGKEVVLRAFSKDGVAWAKNADRVIRPAGYGYDAANFRDPFVLKYADGDYRMIVSTNKNGKPVLAEFKSTDLRDWEHVGVFRDNLDYFHECVDIFKKKENDLWYLVYSDIHDRHVKYYVSKTYEGLKTAGKPYKADGKMDGKSFYAGKTAFDGTNRYIWGWCATRFGQNHNDNEAEGDWAGSLVYHQLVANKESDDLNLSSIKVKCPDILKDKIKAETFWHPEDQTEEYYDEAAGETKTRGYFNLTSGNKVSLPRLYPTNRVTFTVRGIENGEFGLRFIDCKDHKTYSIRFGGEGDNRYRMRFVDDTNPNENINQLAVLNTDVDDWFVKSGIDITMITDNSVCVVYVNDSYAFTNRIYGMEGNPFSIFYNGSSADDKIKISNLKVYTTETSKVLWDGEDRESGTRGGLWDDNTPVVVENPDQSGINKSDKCIKYTAAGRQIIKIPFRNWLQDFDLKGNRRLSFMIKKPTAGNVVMELSDPTNNVSDNYWAKTFAWYGKPDEWQKVAFDFTDNTAMNDYPGFMTIYASLDEKADAEDIYIDNVIVEPLPTVGGAYVGDCEDHGLNGRITLGGSWMRGECTNFETFDNITYDKKRYYDDYAILQNKLTKGVYEADMRNTTVHGIYDNNIAKVNPNCIIYALADNKPMVSDDETADNVVVGNKDEGHADRFVIDEGYPFHCTEDFTAWDGLVKRRMTKGYWNTMLLPFYIKGDAYSTSGDFLNYLGGTYAKLTGERRHANGNVTMLFTTFDKDFEANVPFLVKAENTNPEGDGYNEFKFLEIQICKTPELINFRPTGTNVDFIGNYSYNPETDYTKGVFLPVGSLFLYNDTFKHVVKENANTTKPLRGYFQVYDAPAESKMMFSIDNTPTAITDIDASADAADDNWYTLQGVRISKPQQSGIYINNGKKVIIKK